MLQLRAVLFTAVIAFSWAPAVRSDCDSLAHLDVTCGLEVQFFGNRALKPNSNQATFDDNCKTYETGVNCLTDYSNKCLEARPASLAKTIMKSVKDHFNKRCKDKEFGQEFIEHNKCFDDAAIFESFHQCEDKWYHRMQALQKMGVDVEKGIQSSCCIFHEFQRCIREQNVNLCHDKMANFWDDTLNEIKDDTVNLFCSELKTAEECSKNFPADLWSQIDGPVAAMDAAALKEKSGKFKSMFVTVLDMISQYQLKQ